MKKLNNPWVLGAIVLFFVIVIPLMVVLRPTEVNGAKDPWENINMKRTHLDHSPYFEKEFDSPQAVTRACLECHKDAAKEVMKTSHWTWTGDPEYIPGRGKVKLGKKNLINNFCIGIRGGNQVSCSSCHAGYGWYDDDFDFTKEDNVDCLICHDWSGTYVKGERGMPGEEVDLLKVAKSVGYPKRDNCGICHIYGGGGMGVKHGDLDNTLVNPSEEVDVHMGKHNILCIDCHKTENHDIKGKLYTVTTNYEGGVGCTDCHEEVPHKDSRINAHLDAVACQTCHIPTYAKRAPTKVYWDWSQAGDGTRVDDPHEYLKIKGEFVYDQNIVPEYYWFNMRSSRYLMGDKINPREVTYLNRPRGDITDPKARLWPFKVHRALQPYDAGYNYLVQPITSGPGGYWNEFNWDKAMRLGAEALDMRYSGKYGFTRTAMHWPVSHMVSPEDKALECTDCHGGDRMDWKRLGYDRDPADIGGREDLGLLKEKTEGDR